MLLLTIFYSCFIYLNYLILCLNSALAFFVVVYFDYNKYQRFFCVWPKAFLQLLRAYCAASASAVAMAEATDRRFDAGSQVNVDDNLSLLTSVCWQATTTTTIAFIIFSIAHCQFCDTNRTKSIDMIVAKPIGQSICIFPCTIYRRCQLFACHCRDIDCAALMLKSTANTL